MSGLHDLANRIYDDLRLVHLNVVPRIVDCASLSASRHRRNLIVQVYPELVFRITLLLSFVWTARKGLMRQDDDGYGAQRAIGCPYLVGAREPDVLLLGNSCLQPSTLVSTPASPLLR